MNKTLRIKTTLKYWLFESLKMICIRIWGSNSFNEDTRHKYANHKGEALISIKQSNWIANCSQPIILNFSALNKSSLKHCQRHNAPEGWVNITNSYTNLNQISILESQLTSKSQPNFSILTKLQLKIFTKPSFRISTKI